MNRLNIIERLIVILWLLLRGWTKSKLIKALYWQRIYYKQRASGGML